MTPSQEEAFLFGLRRFGVRPDLAPTRAALNALGAPDRRFTVVQVVGSVGKGSTAATLSSVLRAAGVRTGLFTSPHLVRFRERFRVDDEDVSDGEIAATLASIVARVPWTAPDLAAAGDEGGEAESADEPAAAGDPVAADCPAAAGDPVAADCPAAAGDPDRSPFMTEPGTRRPLTFFEWCTVLACELFARRGVEVAVLEAGLGGRWDATTAVHAEATVITRLALEHTEILGETLREIAGEKAAAIRDGVPVIVADQAPEALAVIRERAREAVAPLHVLGRALHVEAGYEGALRFVGRRSRVDGLRPALLGEHQRENTALALGAAEVLAEEGHVAITPEAVRRGVAEVRWPGRLEEAAPGLWLDGAHEPGALRLLAAEVARRIGPRVQLVFAVIGPRPALAMLAPLLPLAESVVLTRVGGDRARDPDAYAAAVRRHHPAVQVLPDPAEALAAARARGGPVLVCGSLYLVGAVKAVLAGEPVEPGDPQATPARR